MTALHRAPGLGQGVVFQAVWVGAIVAAFLILLAAAIVWIRADIEQACRRLPRLMPGRSQLLNPHWMVGLEEGFAAKQDASCLKLSRATCGPCGGQQGLSGPATDEKASLAMIQIRPSRALSLLIVGRWS